MEYWINWWHICHRFTIWNKFKEYYITFTENDPWIRINNCQWNKFQWIRVLTRIITRQYLMVFWCLHQSLLFKPYLTWYLTPNITRFLNYFQIAIPGRVIRENCSGIVPFKTSQYIFFFKAPLWQSWEWKFLQTSPPLHSWTVSWTTGNSLSIIDFYNEWIKIYLTSFQFNMNS